MLNVYLFLVVFIALPYLMVIFRNLVWDLYLWQVKEYRIDRIWSHWFIERSKGVRSEILTATKVALGTTTLFYLYSPRANVLSIVLFLSFTIVWAESFVFLQKFLNGKFLRPHLKSLRNLIILFLNLIFLALPFILIFQWLVSFNLPVKPDVVVSVDNTTLNDFFPVVSSRGLVIFPVGTLIIIYVTLIGIGLELFSPIITAIGVGLTAPLAYFKRKYTIAKAKVIIRKHAHVKVVSVTGSYGKSTTKELIYQLISTKFKTIKTDKNNNTDIGIAQTILKKLKKNTEVFVAEMGAYKIGEINDCCDVATPDIAIVTGVDQQHVTLYGGIPEILKSTYEVIQKLRNTGLVILNGDNEYCIKLAEKTRKRKKLYFSISNAENVKVEEVQEHQTLMHRVTFPGTENIFVSEIFETSKGLSFIVNFDKQRHQIHSNLKVIYNISNLMAAILVAMELGMSMKEIVKTINEMEFEVPYLNVFNGINKSKILDDGYNVNPTAFIAAVNYMDSLKVKSTKWIMTQGIIELGDEKQQIYRKIAQLIVKAADGLYTSDRYLFEEIKNLDSKFKVVLVNSVFDFPIYYKYVVKENNMVLLEGPFPQIVLDKMYAEKRV